MEHTIGFPNLGLEFTLNRVACTVLGKDIYWYGIILGLGVIFGMYPAIKASGLQPVVALRAE